MAAIGIVTAAAGDYDRCINFEVLQVVTMNEQLKSVKLGLALVLLSLAFGIGVGISFGVNEDSYKALIAAGIEANPAVHDQQSAGKIWRYAQRAHFHATGIASFALGLIILTLFTSLSDSFRKLATVLVGLSGLYPLSWFTMYLLSPSLGRAAAHGHLLTESLAYIGIGGLVAGFLMIVGNIFLGLFSK